MVNENAKSNQIWMKLGTREFSRSLITNLHSKFRKFGHSETQKCPNTEFHRNEVISVRDIRFAFFYF